MHPKSMQDLCYIRSRVEGDQFQALCMADFPTREPGTPYASRWANLKADNQIRADGPTAQEFTQGALHPVLAKELYCSSSNVLMDRVAKSFVWVSSGALPTFNSSFCMWILMSIFVQGQHYTMVLIDCIYDVGRVIEHLSDVNSALHLEVLELKSGSGPEAIATVE